MLTVLPNQWLLFNPWKTHAVCDVKDNFEEEGKPDLQICMGQRVDRVRAQDSILGPHWQGTRALPLGHTDSRQELDILKFLYCIRGSER